MKAFVGPRREGIIHKEECDVSDVSSGSRNTVYEYLLNSMRSQQHTEFTFSSTEEEEEEMSICTPV